MKAISLWQPWASLWLTTAKVHETRHWKTNHRGYLLVHAAKRKINVDEIDLSLWNICVEHFGVDWRDTLARGALIGRVGLIACLSTNENSPIDRVDELCGNFSMNRWMWKRGGFQVFKHPIPYTGRQGIFDIPDKFFLDLMP